MFPTKIIFLHENFMFKNKEKGKGFEKSSECEKSRRRWWKSLVKVPWRQFAVAFGRNFLKVFFFRFAAYSIQFICVLCFMPTDRICSLDFIGFVLSVGTESSPFFIHNPLHLSHVLLALTFLFFRLVFPLPELQKFSSENFSLHFFSLSTRRIAKSHLCLRFTAHCECSRRGKKVLFSLPNILHLYENMLELQRSPSSSGLFSWRGKCVLRLNSWLFCLRHQICSDEVVKLSIEWFHYGICQTCRDTLSLTFYVTCDMIWI